MLFPKPVHQICMIHNHLMMHLVAIIADGTSRWQHITHRGWQTVFVHNGGTEWWHTALAQSSGTVVAHSGGTERGGGAQNTRHVWKSRGWFCRLAIGRDPMVPANERRALGGGGESFHLEAYCSASRPYLLNNWSIVENNSIYEALPRVVEKVSLKVRFRCRGSSGGGQSGKCLICTGHRSTEVQHWVQLLRSAAKSL